MKFFIDTANLEQIREATTDIGQALSAARLLPRLSY